MVVGVMIKMETRQRRPLRIFWKESPKRLRQGVAGPVMLSQMVPVSV